MKMDTNLFSFTVERSGKLEHDGSYRVDDHVNKFLTGQNRWMPLFSCITTYD
jgi:hypothetical protein